MLLFGIKLFFKFIPLEKSLLKYILTIIEFSFKIMKNNYK